MKYRNMDMHVHSCFSVEPVPGIKGVTFSPKETPEELYARAKARGMDFVTITDHDTIDGCLDFLARHPEADDFVVGEEVSTELPVSRLTVHINVYGHDRAQHEELQRRRGDAFAVAAYCREQGLFFVWNHPFYRENLSTIEEEEFMRLVAEVPVIEVRNGGRMQVLNVLAEELAAREGKAMQGGSDTHTGNIGSVYTAVPCEDLASFFAGILARASRIVGHHSTRRDFLLHNYLAGRRHVVDLNLRRMASPLQRVRMRGLGLLAYALSPWVVRRHFRGQVAMARIALANLSAFGHLDETLLLDAA
ncbi:MAG TPA: PHP-associated domain-containing protein [Thermoanaerobaculaceae bacterium]|nr:PHP-associated domain-containing protein [Thermoanaerobaculaceae bacterium]